jgi:hypothetical protein
MSDLDAALERSEQQVKPPVPIRDDDPPARRLLAHDMEHLVWDEDGEQAVPPPD